MKKNFRNIFYCSLLTIICLQIFSACSDGDHDDPLAPIIFNGTITSSVPAVGYFSPITDSNTTTFTWQDETHKLATIEIGEFSVVIDVQQFPQPMTFNIGSMKITDVQVTTLDDGSYILKKDSFNCMAGQYDTTGILDGILDEQNNLEITLTYKPGTMPMEIKSVFKGKKK